MIAPGCRPARAFSLVVFDGALGIRAQLLMRRYRLLELVGAVREGRTRVMAVVSFPASGSGLVIVDSSPDVVCIRHVRAAVFCCGDSGSGPIFWCGGWLVVDAEEVQAGYMMHKRPALMWGNHEGELNRRYETLADRR